MNSMDKRYSKHPECDPRSAVEGDWVRGNDRSQDTFGKRGRVMRITIDTFDGGESESTYWIQWEGATAPDPHGVQAFERIPQSPYVAGDRVGLSLAGMAITGTVVKVDVSRVSVSVDPCDSPISGRVAQFDSASLKRV